MTTGDEADLARRELARRLLPYTDTDHAWALASSYLDDLQNRGWRPPREPLPKLGRPGDAAAGAALARELLAQRLHDILDNSNVSAINKDGG